MMDRSSVVFEQDSTDRRASSRPGGHETERHLPSSSSRRTERARASASVKIVCLLGAKGGKIAGIAERLSLDERLRRVAPR